MSKDMFVCRNSLITKEIVQPLFSQFIINYDEQEFPVFVNKTAAEILRLSDGTKTINDITKILAERYNESVEEIESKLTDFWEFAIKVKHIILSDKPREMFIEFESIGSYEYWTPDMVSVELTHRCPLRCKHCFLSAGEGSVMSMETWNRIFESLKEMKVPQVQITGGEPMVHEFFFDIIDQLIDAGFMVHVFTSGFIDSEEVIKKFEKYCDNKKQLLFQVSLDGLKEYHDDFRGRDGAYEKTIHFIEKITRLGFKTTVGVSVSEQPFDELVQLCEICKKINVRILRLSAISNLGRANANNISSASEDVIDVVNIKKKLIEMFGDDTFKIMLNEEKQDVNSAEDKYLMNCGLGQTSLKIDPEGNIYPCMMARSSYANINNESLLEVQKKHSRRFEELKPPSREACGNCKNINICNKCIIEGEINSCNVMGCNWMRNNAEKLHSCHIGKVDNSINE